MVDILVSNYNSGDAIELCVESVRRYTAPGTYRLVVLNDLCFNGRDDAYLRECRDKGWLALYETEERLHHGGALNRLMNEICRADRAVLLDCDIEIRGGGWLEEGLSLLGPGVLAVCDERPEPCVTAQGYAPGFYRAWFAFFNMTAYRDMGGVDWAAFYQDATAWPYTELYRPWRHVPKQSGFDEARSCEDPGSRLWMKARYGNPRGYRVLPLTPSLRVKHHHYGHAAIFAELPDDHDPYTRAHKRERAETMRARLGALRQN